MPPPTPPHPSRAPDPPTILAAALALSQRARLTDALRHRAALGFLDSFDALTAALERGAEAVDAIVVPARDVNGTGALSFVSEIVRRWPRTAVVAYLSADSRHSAEIRGLAAAGVHQFIFPGLDDSGIALRAILDAARRQCAGDWVMQQLAPVVPVKLHPMVHMALARPDAITTVRRLADALGVQRRTLFNWCVASGFLRPEQVLVWARLSLAAHYLERGGATVETIALELSFPSDTALRNSIKRYTGHRATELRRAGGLRAVIEALARRLEDETASRDLHLE